VVTYTFDRAPCRRYCHRSLQEFPQPDRSKSFRTTALLTWGFRFTDSAGEAARLLILAAGNYLSGMRKSAFEPCIPTRGTPRLAGNDWIDEIDGYRLIVQRDGRRVCLFTRNGHDRSGRFPLITEAALRNRNSSFVIDGEAVLLG
jgi:hypothetical protein